MESRVPGKGEELPRFTFSGSSFSILLESVKNYVLEEAKKARTAPVSFLALRNFSYEIQNTLFFNTINQIPAVIWNKICSYMVLSDFMKVEVLSHHYRKIAYQDCYSLIKKFVEAVQLRKDEYDTHMNKSKIVQTETIEFKMIFFKKASNFFKKKTKMNIESEDNNIESKDFCFGTKQTECKNPFQDPFTLSYRLHEQYNKEKS